MTWSTSTGESGHAVSEVIGGRQLPGRGGLAAWLFQLPFRIVSAAADALLSRRGLAVLFLLVAAGLTLASGLRPPLSRDISSLHVPVGIPISRSTDEQPALPASQREEAGPEALLRGSHPVEPDCVAVVLLAIIAPAALFVLWRPGLIAVAAGLLMCASIAVNAAMLFNHPALIELMDLEYDQSQGIARTVAYSPYKSALTTANTGRLADARPGENEQRADLLRGWTYLLHGQWLVAWGIVGVLFGGRGSMGRRLAGVGLWLLVGVGLAGAVCAGRLQAEYHWSRAKLLEAEGDFESSLQALDHAVTALPEFGRLERTWLLAGKLEHRLGHRTQHEQAFRTYQLARNKVQPRTSNRDEDLPWRVTLSADEREWRRALGLLGNLSLTVQRQGALRHLAGQLWTNVGASFFEVMPNPTDAGFNYFPQKQRLNAATGAWEQATALESARRDCAFSEGLVWESTDPASPSRYAEAFARAMSQLADRLIRADILNTLADGYFRGGEMLKARRHYAESSDAFSVPTHPNRRSQKGIGGGQ
jgi:tetratricopeptide (TPR) repeat protein